mmetsp:Transcript_10880/g.27997  ORF Transcript_10880/g.27997 Transcript_10880/m.27997 type:complete len:382 (-) Transcript_10880:146-1291(-)
MSFEPTPPPSVLAILLDSGTLGIVSIATAIVVFASCNSLTLGAMSGPKDEQDAPVTLTARKAAIFPVVGSFMLLLLYLFFDKIQFLYLVFNAVIAGICLEMVLRSQFAPMIGPPIPKGLHMPFVGVVHTAAALSSAAAFVVTFLWVLSDHWILLDILGAALCTFMLAAIRLPNLKVAAMLFVGLLAYDVFWVFFSARMFETNVMVNVATKHGVNPVQSIASTLSLPMAKGLPQLSIPAKIMFPSSERPGDFSMLGLGDIVLPGILVAHNLRYDNLKTMPHRSMTPTSPIMGHSEPSAVPRRRTYFVHAVCGYVVGLFVAVLCSEKYAMAQPALIYLLPMTLGPTVVLAISRGDLGDLWHGTTLRTTYGDDGLEPAEARHVV